VLVCVCWCLFVCLFVCLFAQMTPLHDSFQCSGSKKESPLSRHRTSSFSLVKVCEKLFMHSPEQTREGDEQGVRCDILCGGNHEPVTPTMPLPQCTEPPARTALEGEGNTQSERKGIKGAVSNKTGDVVAGGNHDDGPRSDEPLLPLSAQQLQRIRELQNPNEAQIIEVFKDIVSRVLIIIIL